MSLPIIIAFDALSGVDGSARFSFGSITAIASVSGPIAPRPATEHPVRASIDVHVRPLAAVPATAEKHTASTLRGILERTCVLTQHPRTAIQVVVQALSPAPAAFRNARTRGDEVEKHARLAAQINAASLALLNAGSIPMRGVVCAIAVAQVSPGEEEGPPLVIDSSRHSNRMAYSGCFAFLFGVDSVRGESEGSSMEVDGAVPPAKLVWTNYSARPGESFSAVALTAATRIALQGAAQVWVQMKTSVSMSSVSGVP